MHLHIASFRIADAAAHVVYKLAKRTDADNDRHLRYRPRLHATRRVVCQSDPRERPHSDAPSWHNERRFPGSWPVADDEPASAAW